MVDIRPFKGLHPRPDMAAKVASPPYDVLDSDEAREMVKDNPYMFLRVVKPEVDFPPEVDIYDEKVYQKGAENLRWLISEGVMVQDPEPRFYFYRQIMGDHSQTGLVAVASVRDYEENRIKKHEFTRKVKEDDRVKHIDTQNAQSGPVFLTYHDVPEMNALQERICQGKEPLFDFTAEDGIRHTLWVVEDSADIEKIKALFKDIPSLYIADGHHRSAAAARVAQKRRAENPNATGEEEYEYFLSVIFPKSHLKILPYNRAVKDLNGHSKEEFLKLVGEKFEVTEGADPEPKEPKHYAMYLDGKWYGLAARDGTYDAEDPVKSLDASILQENLLGPILGIEDPRTSERIKFIGGIRGTKELEKLVDSGKFTVAFSLYPTSIDQLIDVAESGNVMPPKSTWFEPKLRSGVVIHLL